MRQVPVFVTGFATVVLLALSACGSNRQAEQASAPAPTPAAAAAPTEPAAPPPEAAAPVAQTEAPPAASRPAPAPARKPAPKPQPAVAANPPSAPKPQPVLKTVAATSEVDVELVSAVSSKTSKVGDAFSARVTKAVFVDGLTVIPTGAVINGTVTEAVPLNKIGGTAKLGLRFSSLEL